MSTFPLIESILLEIHQSVGCKGYPTTKKNKFATGQASIDNHNAMGQEIMWDILSALGLRPDDPRAAARVTDILDFQIEFANAYKTLELQSWTFAASERQIVWMLLGHFYVSEIARYVGVLSVDQTLDIGMPGGQFWYLPEIHEAGGESELYLPVTQVIDWLLDLLGMTVEQFADQHDEATGSEQDKFRRSLYNWRTGTTIQVKKIDEYFSDNKSLIFKGVFTPDADISLEKQFKGALEFVAQKKLTAESLRREIPITQDGRLERILEGRADDREQATFVDYLVARYSAPSMHTIRQRLMVARAVQDGYARLLKYLCPGVDLRCVDPHQNKLLQLFAIYKVVYNISISASVGARGQGLKAEEVCFDGLLPKHDKYGLFLSIVPSLRKDAIPMLAKRLTRQFYDMKTGDELEDHFGLDEQTSASIMQRHEERTAAFAAENGAEQKLLTRINNFPHWRVLQSEGRIWVLYQLAKNKALKPKAKNIVVERLYELAIAPADKLQAIVLELDGHLNGADKRKETRGQVELLLKKAEAIEGNELWIAPLLKYKAKHLLFCNDFDAAGTTFRQALDASSKRNYGTLAGEIARDCLAIAVANQKLIHNNHEKYYRLMLAGRMMSGSLEDLPGFEETARDLSNYFWNDLYKPYSGVPVEKRRAKGPIEDLFKELVPLLLQWDQSGVDHLIKTNRKLFNSALPDVDGNSVLMLLTKMFNDILDNINSMTQPMPLDQQHAIDQLEKLVSNGQRFLEILLSGDAKQLDLVDFKRQSPLMLMAERGSTKFVGIMLRAGANPDLQDYRGMTALHGAIKSRVDDCVDVLLHHRCNLNLCTRDDRSPLHTACLFGSMHSVKRLSESAPELIWKKHLQERTPLEEVEFWIENPDAWQKQESDLAKTGVICATVEELKHIAKLLEQVPAPR